MGDSGSTTHHDSSVLRCLLCLESSPFLPVSLSGFSCDCHRFVVLCWHCAYVFLQLDLAPSLRKPFLCLFGGHLMMDPSSCTMATTIREENLLVYLMGNPTCPCPFPGCPSSPMPLQRQFDHLRLDCPMVFTQCTECQTWMSRGEMHTSHVRTCGKEHCSFCGEWFRENEVEEHYLSVHNKRKCQICHQWEEDRPPTELSSSPFQTTTWIWKHTKEFFRNCLSSIFLFGYTQEQHDYD